MSLDYSPTSKVSEAEKVHMLQTERGVKPETRSLGLQKPYGGRYGRNRSSKIKLVPKDTILEDVTVLDNGCSQSGINDENLNSIKTNGSRKFPSLGSRFGFKPTVVKATVHHSLSLEEDGSVDKGQNNAASTKLLIKQTQSVDVLVHRVNELSVAADEKEKSDGASSHLQPTAAESLPFADVERGNNGGGGSSSAAASDPKSSVAEDALQRNHGGDLTEGMNWSQKLSDADSGMKSDTFTNDSSMMSSTPHPTDQTEMDKLDDAFRETPAQSLRYIPAHVAPIASGEMVESLESPSLMSVDSDELMLETEVDLGDYDYSDDLLDSSALPYTEVTYRMDHVMSRSRSNSRKLRRHASGYERSMSGEEEAKFNSLKYASVGENSSDLRDASHSTETSATEDEIEVIAALHNLINSSTTPRLVHVDVIRFSSNLLIFGRCYLFFSGYNWVFFFSVPLMVSCNVFCHLVLFNLSFIFSSASQPAC